MYTHTHNLGDPKTRAGRAHVVSFPPANQNRLGPNPRILSLTNLWIGHSLCGDLIYYCSGCSYGYYLVITLCCYYGRSPLVEKSEGFPVCGGM